MSFKDQILVFLEGHNFKTDRRGTHPHLKTPMSFMTMDSMSPSAALRWGTEKGDGARPYKMRGVPQHEPKFRKSEDLYHMTKTQCNEVLESSWGFSELSRWHSLKVIGAAQQDETNTAGTWRRLIQRVILAGRQGKILRHCVCGVKKISSSFS